MRVFKIILLLTFFSYCSAAAQTPLSSYEQLSPEGQKKVDTIIDELKRHHLFILPELGDINNIKAATAREENLSSAGVSDKEHGHEHESGEDSSYQDEHLDIKITQAFADKDGKYHTPTIQLTPTKMYTYEGLYTVTIGEKLIKVTLSEVEENNPKRVPGMPDEDLVKDLAKRLKGKATFEGLIATP